MPITRRSFLAASPTVLGGQQAERERTIVLTFDDAVRSHLTFVAPLLKDAGFGATFFVTHRWMDDKDRFLGWEEIAGLHEMGFEVGNHTWGHRSLAVPRNAARLAGELALMETSLERAGVPRPASFAWPGNAFGPEAFGSLAQLGYRFGRRGAMPESKTGEGAVGPVYDSRRNHPLLIPTTGNARPDWTLDHFRRVLDKTTEGVVVLQFHGVPDDAHPWVHTPPQMFEQYVQYLRDGGYRVIAVRDLEAYVDRDHLPADPLVQARHPEPKGDLELPVEMEATRHDLDYWLPNMRVHHGYTVGEAALVTGLPESEIRARQPEPLPEAKVLPYPGGRHPRVGFLEGAIDPLRGTKASVFLPWDRTQYVVVDLPEAIFSNRKLLFLAHTHVVSVWDEQNVMIENTDWTRLPDGSLRSEWRLPNDIRFGAMIRPGERDIAMELWLANGTAETLTGLRTQICVMFRGASSFAAPTTDNKIFRKPTAAAKSSDGVNWVLTSWERCGRVWGNPRCPCMHSDPILPDCTPGETVQVRGRLWFHQGTETPV